MTRSTPKHFKACRECKFVLPITDYKKHHNLCNTCLKAQKRAYYYRNKARIRKQENERRAANPELFRERTRAFYRTHREHVNAYQRERYHKDVEASREYGRKKYYKNHEHNREQKRLNTRRRNLVKVLALAGIKTEQDGK